MDEFEQRRHDDDAAEELRAAKTKRAEDVRPDVAGLVAKLRATSSKAFGSWPWELCLQAAAMIESLAGERDLLVYYHAESERARDADRADAERWRFMRDHELSPWAAARTKGAKTPADIDAAIDAAREVDRG
jgi:hypothetical protein